MHLSCPVYIRFLNFLRFVYKHNRRGWLSCSSAHFRSHLRFFIRFHIRTALDVQLKFGIDLNDRSPYWCNPWSGDKQFMDGL